MYHGDSHLHKCMLARWFHKPLDTLHHLDVHMYVHYTVSAYMWYKFHAVHICEWHMFCQLKFNSSNFKQMKLDFSSEMKKRNQINTIPPSHDRLQKIVSTTTARNTNFDIIYSVLQIVCFKFINNTSIEMILKSLCHIYTHLFVYKPLWYDRIGAISFHLNNDKQNLFDKQDLHVAKSEL